MNVSIIWNDGSRMSFTCDRPNFTIDNTDKNVFRSIEVRTPELKTLTDDEIIQIWGVESIWNDKLIAFARAVLKKASK